MQNTVEKGESNSALLIGMRGSGKTRTLRRVLDKLQERNENGFHTVWLNGLIHSDDKSALKEIMRQLAAERNVKNELSFVGFFGEGVANRTSHPLQKHWNV